MSHDGYRNDCSRLLSGSATQLPTKATKLAWQAGALRKTLVGAGAGVAIGLAIVALKRALL